MGERSLECNVTNVIGQREKEGQQGYVLILQNMNKSLVYDSHIITKKISGFNVLVLCAHQ